MSFKINILLTILLLSACNQQAQVKTELVEKESVDSIKILKENCEQTGDAEFDISALNCKCKNSEEELIASWQGGIRCLQKTEFEEEGLWANGAVFSLNESERSDVKVSFVGINKDPSIDVFQSWVFDPRKFDQDKNLRDEQAMIQKTVQLNIGRVHGFDEEIHSVMISDENYSVKAKLNARELLDQFQVFDIAGDCLKICRLYSKIEKEESVIYARTTEIIAGVKVSDTIQRIFSMDEIFVINPRRSFLMVGQNGNNVFEVSQGIYKYASDYSSVKVSFKSLDQENEFHYIFVPEETEVSNE